MQRMRQSILALAGGKGKSRAGRGEEREVNTVEKSKGKTVKKMK